MYRTKLDTLKMNGPISQADCLDKNNEMNPNTTQVYLQQDLPSRFNDINVSTEHNNNRLYGHNVGTETNLPIFKFDVFINLTTNEVVEIYSHGLIITTRTKKM